MGFEAAWLQPTAGTDNIDDLGHEHFDTGNQANNEFWLNWNTTDSGKAKSWLTDTINEIVCQKPLRLRMLESEKQKEPEKIFV